jgi:hypothetical protein
MVAAMTAKPYGEPGALTTAFRVSLLAFGISIVRV